MLQGMSRLRRFRLAQVGGLAILPSMAADPNVSSDQIHIEQLALFGRVGVPEAERAEPQRLLANITVWPMRDLRELDDDIAQTVNYSAVADAARKFVEHRCDKLLETLAQRLATHLLERFAVRQLRLELRKFPLPDAQYVSVTVTRSAAER